MWLTLHQNQGPRYNTAASFHLGVPYYQAEIKPVEPDQVMLVRKGKQHFFLLTCFYCDSTPVRPLWLRSAIGHEL